VNVQASNSSQAGRAGADGWPRAGLKALAAAAVLALCVPAQALSLAEAFEAARAHDPQYTSSAFDLEATREGIPIARAGLMPQVSLFGHAKLSQRPAAGGDHQR
jgi:outer membrane protein TolC